MACIKIHASLKPPPRSVLSSVSFSYTSAELSHVRKGRYSLLAGGTGTSLSPPTPSLYPSPPGIHYPFSHSDDRDREGDSPRSFCCNRDSDETGLSAPPPPLPLSLTALFYRDANRFTLKGGRMVGEGEGGERDRRKGINTPVR